MAKWDTVCFTIQNYLIVDRDVRRLMVKFKMNHLVSAINVKETVVVNSSNKR
uniref:Uncharacterized protein n=1 Tax=Parascaris equorum TaxID=6256 RepID=A0A914RQZ7_PAREQ